MIRRGILLAAGRGSRLGALTANCPKPLLELAGQPIIGHILSGLAAAGLTEVAVVTGYLADLLEQRLGDGRQFGLTLRYFRQPIPDGTARAVALARDFLAGQPFFFGWGDILVLPGNYRQLLAAHQGEAAILAVNRVDDPWAGAAVYVDEQRRVERIIEKPPRGTSTTRWNNAGLGLLDERIWPYLDRLRPSARGEYELPQAVAAMVEDGLPVRAVPVDGPWFDIGTPADLETARRAFRELTR